MNYDTYHLSAREWLIICGEYTLIILLISYLFYDSYFSLFVLMPFIILFINWEKNKKCRKRRDELEKEFLKSLQSIATSLAAGYSPENAIKESYSDMEKMFGKKAIIVKELELINGRIASGDRLEDALYDFAKRSQSAPIEDFAIIFSIGKKSGGRFSKIISSCVEIMQQTKETEEEIKVLIRGKQYEQRIMSIIPLGIILYLRISSGSFMEVLYHNILGIIIMTICLILYVLSIIISEKICQIEL